MNYKDDLILEEAYLSIYDIDDKIYKWIENNTNINRYDIIENIEIDDNHKINFKNLSIYLNSDVVEIPHFINFGYVREFHCKNCEELKSLKNFPDFCNVFECIACPRIKNLEGGPKKCVDYYCRGCKSLTTLKGAPTNCSYFGCDSSVSLENLKFAPSECETFNCTDCKKLNHKTKYPTDKYGKRSNIKELLENHIRRMALTSKEFGEEGSSLF